MKLWQVKEKWTELFEKVIGRKPTPQEFLEGKKGFFDLKEIKKLQELIKQMICKKHLQILSKQF